jgi:ligand-binding sensor domain-containing protein
MSDGRYEPYVETEGLKVSPGCLTQAGGRVYAGSDGRGLWRLSADGGRFERLSADLPSPRVTALLASKDALFVGTDEGLARMPLADGPEPGGAPGAAP